MTKRWFKLGTATFAVAALASLMFHAGTSTGCGGARRAPASSDLASQQGPGAASSAAAAEAEEEEEEDAEHLPASKAGPIFPRKPRGAPEGPQKAKK